MRLSGMEISILRELAVRYAQVALLPEQSARRERWMKFNDESMERPMVLIDQLPWHEMDADGSLTCRVEQPYWRAVEREMRRTIYKWEHLKVDMVVDPYIPLPRPIINSGWGIEQSEQILSIDDKNSVVAHRYENQIRDFDDIERLQLPTVALDMDSEAEIRALAGEIFGGVLPFRMTGICMHLGIWDTITTWMGIENCYIELMERPRLMHALMEKLTEGLLHQINQMNRLGLFDIHSNLCHCSHTYTRQLPGEMADEGHPQSQNAWAFGLAQLFTSVSPAITREFEAEYMKRIFPRFGAVYYGCCDRLDDRLDVVETMPNIRKVSCSPWNDVARFAENLNPKYVMSRKPNPAHLAATGLDEAVIREELRRTISAAKSSGLRLEFILKDISTVRYEPARLWRWAEIAMEEVSR